MIRFFFTKKIFYILFLSLHFRIGRVGNSSVTNTFKDVALKNAPAAFSNLSNLTFRVWPPNCRTVVEPGYVRDVSNYSSGFLRTPNCVRVSVPVSAGTVRCPLTVITVLHCVALIRSLSSVPRTAYFIALSLCQLKIRRGEVAYVNSPAYLPHCLLPSIPFFLRTLAPGRVSVVLPVRACLGRCGSSRRLAW